MGSASIQHGHDFKHLLNWPTLSMATPKGEYELEEELTNCLADIID
jgi:hypothetical protein